MRYTNAYFQLVIRENGVFIRIFPAQTNGKPIMMPELFQYLEQCGITEYDIPKLTKEVSMAKEIKEIYVSSDVIAEVNEKASVRVSEDKMLVVIRFYPPSENGKRMTEREILNELTKCRIRHGISEKIIRAFVTGPQYCRDIPIAKGTAVVQGKDAMIQYMFDTEPTSKPKLLEDGSVDFHELNLFTSVKQGELLAKMTPEVEGTPGMDVFGNKVMPLKVKRGVLKYGRNIELSEDKTEIYSQVDGDVKLEGDMVFVSNTYRIAANVDPSTGDIHYIGNVVIPGNVCAGFTVEASGDIEVDGVVEGATLIAGGNIVLKRGVQGMNRCLLKAGNDIIAKFIESCTVKAGRTVNVGSCLHSNVDAGEQVIVSGRKGFVIGGNVSAGKRIEASVFGNKMNTATELKVGVEPEILDRVRELSVSIKTKQDELSENKQILEAFRKKMTEGVKLLPNQLVAAKQAGELFKQLSADLEAESKEYLELKQAIEEKKGGRIVVNYTIYPGVSIHIANRIYPVKDVRSRCQFHLDGADVVSMSM